MLDQAITYYKRAEELAVQDEDLYYNMARAYLDNKDTQNALVYLLKSLDMDPRLEPAVKFLTWMLSKSLVPAEMKSSVAQAIQKIKEAQEHPVQESAPAESEKMTAPASTDPDA